MRHRPWLCVLVGMIVIGAALAGEGKNILNNPGFEEGKRCPQSWSEGAAVQGVEYMWDQKTGFKSKASVCLQKSAKRYFPIAQWFQIVEKKETAAQLEVSANVKADDVTKAIIDVIFLDANGKWISHKWVSYIGQKKQDEAPATHDWKEYSGKVEIPPKTAKIQVALQIYGPGRVWFDDIRAEYVK